MCNIQNVYINPLKRGNVWAVKYNNIKYIGVEFFEKVLWAYIILYVIYILLQTERENKRINAKLIFSPTFRYENIKINNISFIDNYYCVWTTLQRERSASSEAGYIKNYDFIWMPLQAVKYNSLPSCWVYFWYYCDWGYCRYVS